MGGHKDWKTADELMAELEQKPEFVERQRQKKAEREENRRRYGEAAARLLGDLESAGFTVETLVQLRDRGVGGGGAVPVLVDWLPRVTYLPLRDLIATLGSPWARPAIDPAVDATRMRPAH